MSAGDGMLAVRTEVCDEERAEKPHQTDPSQVRYPLRQERDLAIV
jgi:hypothetical protein